MNINYEDLYSDFLEDDFPKKVKIKVKNQKSEYQDKTLKSNAIRKKRQAREKEKQNIDYTQDEY